METKPGDLEGLAQTTAKAMEPEKKEDNTTPKANDPAPPAAAEAAPDPEEDDLDDLDGKSHNPQRQSQSSPKYRHARRILTLKTRTHSPLRALWARQTTARSCSDRGRHG